MVIFFYFYLPLTLVIGLFGFVVFFLDWKGGITGKIWHGLTRSVIFMVFWPLILLIGILFGVTLFGPSSK
jgi:hypothetical protein